MNEFRELSTPEVEEGVSIYTGKWFVFVNGHHGTKYVNDDHNFLHKSGKKMCKLRKDSENGGIMFDTELDAFTKSIEFYALHNEIYPWAAAYGKCLGAKYIADTGVDINSQTMRFD